MVQVEVASEPATGDARDRRSETPSPEDMLEGVCVCVRTCVYVCVHVKL